MQIQRTTSSHSDTLILKKVNLLTADVAVVGIYTCHRKVEKEEEERRKNTKTEVKRPLHRKPVGVSKNDQEDVSMRK